MAQKEDLAKSLAAELNKQFKSEGQVAFFIGGENETPTDVKEWIPTGSSILDLAISNKPHGGYPVGRIIELSGLEASGKSLLCAHAIANVQKMGGIAVYIDTENAQFKDFLLAIGVDIEKMIYVQLDTVEDIFTAVESMVNKIRETNKNKLVLVVVDSIMAATTKDEKAGDYDKDGWATGKAIIISKALRKLTRLIGKERIVLLLTNQLREKMGVMFGDKYCVDPYTTKIKIRYKIDE